MSRSGCCALLQRREVELPVEWLEHMLEKICSDSSDSSFHLLLYDTRMYEACSQRVRFQGEASGRRWGIENRASVMAEESRLMLVLGPQVHELIGAVAKTRRSKRQEREVAIPQRPAVKKISLGGGGDSTRCNTLPRVQSNTRSRRNLFFEIPRASVSEISNDREKMKG